MPAPEITVVQLNLYRMRWRWRERARLVLDELQQLAPDVVTLQEVAPFRCQAQWLARQVNRRLPGHRYRAYVSRKQGWRGLLEGVAVLSRLPVRRFASHPIGDTRVAQRIVLRVADRDITLINTHLSAGGDARETRIAQAHHIVARLPAGRVPLVVAGDLNAQP
ncbi:MAG: endonuclease/exonuclease/phosphatase family protein [Dehalococcoidia bacterium]|nr:endonuclease/exonuclease/phosphatase family protein [Dehalococcoidia bacterium]